ncbi:hypothetical protein LINPERPRIM_LOCUS32608 [Linum perenne]
MRRCPRMRSLHRYPPRIPREGATWRTDHRQQRQGPRLAGRVWRRGEEGDACLPRDRREGEARFGRRWWWLWRRRV